MTLREIELRILALDAFFRRVHEAVPHVGGVQQRLGRNAADCRQVPPSLRIFFNDARS